MADAHSIERIVEGFLNSAFVSAFLSALAGAGLGVWGAQMVAERNEKRKEQLTALKQANAIIVLAHNIANTAFSFKKQGIQPLIAQFLADQKLAEDANEAALAGKVVYPPPNLHADMTKLTPLVIPIDGLKSLVFSGNMPGKALALTAMIEQSATELSHALQIRSELIDDFRRNSLPERKFLERFFGLRQADGNQDCMYSHSMQAITQYTDDLAFFAAELASELAGFAKVMHGKLVAAKAEPPKPSSVDFDAARKAGLLPSREDYKDWLDGFRKAD